MATVQLELPEELIKTANLSLTHLSLDVSKMIALELFREYAISMGKAAELCGIPLEQFMEFAAQREVPVHYTLEDLEEDRKVIESLKL